MFRLIERSTLGLPENPSQEVLRVVVAQHLLEETGGTVMLNEGDIVQMPDPRFLRVPVYSTDGLTDVPLEAGRQRFTVQFWDTKKGRGTVLDQFGIEYVVRSGDLLPECKGRLDVGETISAYVEHQFSLGDVLVESGPRRLRERREFEGHREKRPFWTPGISGIQQEK